MPLPSHKSPITVSHPLSVKLDDKNFLLWQQQILYAVNGHDLGVYIEVESVVPERSSSKYQSWHKQDQLLLSWQFSSMSESILTRVVGCRRSHEVWKRISEYFSAHTRAKVHQYKSGLRNTKKGTRSIAEYLLWIKALVDGLISIGSEVTEQEYIGTILEGLSSEYDAFSTAIRTRKEPYTLSEIESLLLAQETRSDSTKSIIFDITSANLTTLNYKDQNVSTDTNSFRRNSRGNS